MAAGFLAIARARNDGDVDAYQRPDVTIGFAVGSDDFDDLPGRAEADRDLAHTRILLANVSVDLAKQLQDLGCQSICFKDMAALLKPQPAYDLVKGIKQACGPETLVHVHVHSTTGVTLVSLMKAIEAGADIVDTSISSLSLGPGHNPTEALVEMLEGTSYTTRLNKEKLARIKELIRRHEGMRRGTGEKGGK